AEVGGVDEGGGAGGVELRHERVGCAAAGGGEVGRGGRGVGGAGVALHVGVAGGGDRDARARVSPDAAGVGGGEEGVGAGGVGVCLVTNSLDAPPRVVWKAPGVVGKSVELVFPVT